MIQKALIFSDLIMKVMTGMEFIGLAFQSLILTVMDTIYIQDITFRGMIEKVLILMVWIKMVMTKKATT